MLTARRLSIFLILTDAQTTQISQHTFQYLPGSHHVISKSIKDYNDFPGLSRALKFLDKITELLRTFQVALELWAYPRVILENQAGSTTRQQ